MPCAAGVPPGVSAGVRNATVRRVMRVAIASNTGSPAAIRITAPLNTQSGTPNAIIAALATSATTANAPT